MRKENLVVGNHYIITDKCVDACVHVEQGYGYSPAHVSRDSVLEYVGPYSCSNLFRIVSFGVPDWQTLPGYARQTNITIRVSTCRGIEPHSVAKKPVTRAEKADAIEAELNEKEEKIAELVTELAGLRNDITRGERQIDMLRKYESDEQALAATFARILKSGGSESEILDILKEFGTTNKL